MTTGRSGRQRGVSCGCKFRLAFRGTAEMHAGAASAESNAIDLEQTLKGRSASGRTKLWCQAAFKAFSIHPIKWSGLSGLFRKQTAPAFMARARTLPSG